MKYFIMTMVAALITAAILPFLIQFTSWAAAWVRGKQTDMANVGQEKEDAPLGPLETTGGKGDIT